MQGGVEKSDSQLGLLPNRDSTIHDYHECSHVPSTKIVQLISELLINPVIKASFQTEDELGLP